MSTKKLEKTIGDNPIHPIENAPVYFGGLTKREYFAVMAMQGILSDKKLYRPDDIESACADAVKMADQLINQLNQTK